MERLGGEDIGQRASIRQAAFASFIGTAIEWYDFFLYGTAAALVFNQLFFPTFAPLTGTLASFATFGVGFFARPVGGVVFGHFGDRIGRKSMLVITLLVMGGATFLIGLLPTFERVGVLAPVLLVILRFLQGFAVGGEWGGATLMAVEHAPEESRNFYASWPQMGAPAGLVLSTAVFTAFSSLPDEQFFAWGWRVPFLLSIILIGVGLFIRLRVLELPAFARVKELGAESRVAPARGAAGLPRDRAARHRGRARQHRRILPGYHVHADVRHRDARGGEERAPDRAPARRLRRDRGYPDLRPPLRPHRQTPRGPLERGHNPAARLPVLLAHRHRGAGPDLARHVSVDLLGWRALRHNRGLYRGALRGAGTVLRDLLRLPDGGDEGGGALAPIIATALIQWADGASWPVATYLAANSLISLVAVYLASENYRVQIFDEQPGERLAGERG